MERSFAKDLTDRITDTYWSLPSMVESGVFLSGILPVKISGDMLSFFSRKMGIQMMSNFGGVAFNLAWHENRSQLLVPRGFGLEEIKGGAIKRLAVLPSGSIEIPGIGAFFLGGEDDLVVAGAGAFLEVRRGSEVRAELDSGTDEEVGRSYEREAGGLSTDPVGLPEVAA